MKSYLLILLALMTVSTIRSQSCNLDSEGFEGTATASPPSGWQIINSFIGNTNPNNGLLHAGFNTLGDMLIVEPLNCPDQICFFWRASGTTSNFDIDIDWSSDNGLTWNNAHRITLNGIGSPTAYQQTCVNLPENLYPAPFTGILIRFHQSRRVGGSFYLDDVCIDAGSCSVTPSQLSISLPLACIQTGLPFSVEVCATDNNGFTASAYNGTVSLSLAQGSGILSGTLSRPAISGCATFNGLSLNTADVNYQLSAADGTLSGISALFDVVSQCPSVDTLRVMSYNLLNFPNGRDDCGVNSVIPARWDTLAIITSYVRPDILMVCELQNEAGTDSILNQALNINGETAFRRAAFVVNQSPAGSSLNNMLFYNSAKMSLYRQSLLRTHLRDISYYTLLMNDPGLAAGNDSVFLDVFVGHLDASAIDSLSRKRGCDTLRRYLDTAVAPRNVLFGGDFNFYRSAETGYLTLLSGTWPLFDPINSPGEWTANAAFAPIHTQATRSSATASMDCGALGGLDDRFDFILASAPVMNGTNSIEYIPNTYRALANSANLFNRSLNDPLNNASDPAAVKNALFHMSDHLPVVMDLEVTYPTALLSFDVLDFSGEAQTSGNLLKWNLSSALDISRYILQSSADGIYFRDIAVLESNGNIGEFLDMHAGQKTYYRLKSVLTDKVLKSKIIFLERKELPLQELIIYPNPVNSMLQIKLSDDAEFSSLRIFNSLGQMLKEEYVSANLLYEDVSALSAGFYLLIATDIKGNQYQHIFIKQ